MRFLLVHSPLVGPVTWRWVAESLKTAGHEVVVPDLRVAATAGRPHGFAVAAATAAPSSWAGCAVVGHSGAGAFLPSIGAAIGAAHLVFVDAGLPQAGSESLASSAFRDQLRALAIDGILPSWSTWWGDSAMAALVPDDARRALVEAEMPQVPISFYEEAMDLPGGWEASGAGYLLLSESYREDATRAGSLGWPLIERLGGHLDLVSEPDEVARAIVVLSRRPRTIR